MTKGVRLLRDSASSDTTRMAPQKMASCRFGLAPHLPHSTGLEPSDQHLSPDMRKILRGRVFARDGETKETVMDILEVLDPAFF